MPQVWEGKAYKNYESENFNDYMKELGELIPSSTLHLNSQQIHSKFKSDCHFRGIIIYRIKF